MIHLSEQKKLRVDLWQNFEEVRVTVGLDKVISLAILRI